MQNGISGLRRGDHAGSGGVGVGVGGGAAASSHLRMPPLVILDQPAPRHRLSCESSTQPPPHAPTQPLHPAHPPPRRRRLLAASTFTSVATTATANFFASSTVGAGLHARQPGESQSRRVARRWELSPTGVPVAAGDILCSLVLVLVPPPGAVVDPCRDSKAAHAPRGSWCTRSGVPCRPMPLISSSPARAWSSGPQHSAETAQSTVNRLWTGHHEHVSTAGRRISQA